MCNSETITPKSIEDCLDPGFGYENGDGYVRIWEVPKNQGGQLVMRHRWFWELQRGPIPEGYEINHLCKNRRCCNVDHLECMPRKDHRIKDNGERYKSVIEMGCQMLRDGHPKGYVAEATGRSMATINSWIRKGLVYGS